MPLHHYLPASFLSRFSSDKTTNPSRNRLLVVGDKKNSRVFTAPASKVGCIQNLYALVDNSTSPNDIDQTWLAYEQKLPTAIDRLINRDVDAELWARVLVPFVACMLVRGPDFSKKFNLRWSSAFREKAKDILSNDNANKARLLDLQRLLGFVATAKWLVLTVQGDEQLITNDLGYSPFINPISKEQGMAIPLAHDRVLGVIPTIVHHPVLIESNDKWTPIISYIVLPTNNHQGLNKSLAKNGLRFIFGSDKAIIKKYTQGSKPVSISPEPVELGFPDGRFSRAHEFTWHRLVGAINRSPSDKGSWDFPINIEILASGWHSELIFPMNLVEFPPALKKVKNSIQTRFYDPEIYYALSSLQMMEKAGQHKDIINLSTDTLNKNKPPLHIKAKILGIRGASLADTGKYKEAIKDYRNAISLDRESIELQINLGYTMTRYGRFAEAHKVLSKVIKNHPQNGIAYNNRAVTNWKLERHDAAIADARTAIKLLPDGVEKASAYLNRGNILNELGQNQEASKDIAKANRMFKKYSKTNNSTISQV